MERARFLPSDRSMGSRSTSRHFKREAKRALLWRTTDIAGISESLTGFLEKKQLERSGQNFTR